SRELCGKERFDGSPASYTPDDQKGDGRYRAGVPIQLGHRGADGVRERAVQVRGRDQRHGPAWRGRRAAGGGQRLAGAAHAFRAPHCGRALGGDWPHDDLGPAALATLRRGAAPGGSPDDPYTGQWEAPKQGNSPRRLERETDRRYGEGGCEG